MSESVYYKQDDCKIWRNSADQLHRTDGPAVEFASGDKQWYFKGERITKKEYYSKDFQVKIVMES
jgi:hypothetical protein